MTSRFRIFSVFAFVAATTGVAAGASSACVGDCNGDRLVAVNELVLGVNIALGAPVDQCPSFDADGSGAVEVNELVQAVNAALQGCPPVDPIFPADYRDTFVEVRECRLSIEHGGVSVRVLASPDAAGPYLREENPLPLGSVVIKEEYEGPTCDNDEELVRWRAMRKEEPGFDPEDNDWHWQYVLSDRSVLLDDKATCISCHRDEDCVARDYMCTEGEGPLPRVDIVVSGLPNALLSVTGTAWDDVYAVGADPDDGSGPYVVHFDGTAWTPLPTGASGDLWWISTEPIGGDFFMSGEGGLLLQYDPEGGQFTKHDTPGDALLFGVWGADPEHIWAVGGDLLNEDTGGVVWFFDGATWAVQDLSAARPEGIPTLYKVWGRGASDVYAVGRLGVVFHFDGAQWTQVPSGSVRPLFTVHGNADTVAASGGIFGDGVLLEDRGSGFSSVVPAGALQLNGVFLAAHGNGAAVGIEGTVALRRDGDWLLQQPAIDSLNDFHATWIDPEGGIWAVGGELTFNLSDGMIAYGGTRTIPANVTAAFGALPAH